MTAQSFRWEQAGDATAQPEAVRQYSAAQVRQFYGRAFCDVYDRASSHVICMGLQALLSQALSHEGGYPAKVVGIMEQV